jgi:protein gp37
MTTQTAIEWTEQTWNPVTGCTKISPGCKHCYAETMAKRLHAMGVRGYEENFKLTLVPARLEEPLKRRKPTTYFVNSMSDLFHEQVPDTYIQQVFDVIRQTPQHTYQILTKRADRLPDFFSNCDAPENAWIGVSVENRKQIRFLSVEPLLEDLGKINLRGIHWVIVGGESGPKARPMKQEWVINIQRQCEQQNVAFFFKQWGGWGADGKKRAKKQNGRVLLGRTWDDMPSAAISTE